MGDLTHSSPLLGAGVTLGNLAVWFGLASAITCAVLYWTAMIRTMRRPAVAAAGEIAPGAKRHGNGAKRNGNGARPEAASPADRKTERVALWARRFFYINGSFVLLGTLCLWSLIFAQQYNVAYIFKNTNSSLHPGYRFAALWSDQQGTFFLWGLYNLILGSVFLRKAREDERWVMPFFSLINISLFTLLTFMNPFWFPPVEESRKLLVEANAPGELMSILPTTAWQHVVYYLGWAKYLRMVNGQGLNEQLQNFWMVIHPPTLFVGYSSMMIPGCYALAALMRRDYDGWAHRASSWLTFSWAVLGTGIFLGAYWAYETLGWGGYWSWDPVENSSIIPWLVGTALIHGLLAQRNRGNFKQANLFLGLLAGVSVLLGSFLVRSGVLSEVSVHSFASPQKSVFMTLLIVMVSWFVMSMGLWLWRFRDIQAEIAYEHVWERHFGFFLGLIVLSASAIVVTFGVTFPIWRPWLPGGGKAAVDFTFYNKALLPVVFMMVLLMAITPLMPWRRVREEGRAMRPFALAILGLSAVVTLFFLFGAVYAWQGGFTTQNDPAYLAFGLMMLVGLATNGVYLTRAARGGLLNSAPWLAHIGFIIMLGGVVITSRYNTTHSVQKLEQGESVRVLGREFIFRGQRPASGPTDRDRLLVEMVTDGKSQLLAPKLFVSKQTGQTMAWPEIVHEWFGGAWGDVYVEPTGVDNTGTIQLKEIKKDAEQPTLVRIQHRKSDPVDDVIVTFVGLDTSEMQRELQNPTGKEFVVYADVRLNINGEERTLKPGLKLVPSEDGRGIVPESIPLQLAGLRQGTPYALHFKDSNMQPGALEASFELVPEQKVSQGYFQVLHVPGIQVLWFGCYILFGGAFLCYVRRSRLAGRPVPVRVAKAGSAAGETVRTPASAERAAPGRNPEPAGAE